MDSIRSFRPWPHLSTLFTLSAGIALAVGGCGGEEDEGVDQQAALANLERCGLVISGRVPTLPDDEYNGCQTHCLEAIKDCSILESGFCGGGDPADQDLFDQCLNDCFGFTCGDGTHVVQEWVCDGEIDCNDAADEGDCDPNLFFVCADADKILKGLRCDGYADCEDYSDEDSCPAIGSFTCDNGTILPANYRCDGSLECDGSTGFEEFSEANDVSDEMGCDVPTALFQCDNGAYVGGYQECNGRSDCSDLSDEPADCYQDLCPGY